MGKDNLLDKKNARLSAMNRADATVDKSKSTFNFVKRSKEELKQSRNPAYKYMFL